MFKPRKSMEIHWRVHGSNTSGSLRKSPFILSFPIKNGGSFHSYVNVYQRVESSEFASGFFSKPSASRRKGSGEAKPGKFNLTSTLGLGAVGCLKGWGQNPKWNKMKWGKKMPQSWVIRSWTLYVDWITDSVWEHHMVRQGGVFQPPHRMRGARGQNDDPSVLHNSSWFNKWLKCIKISGVRGSKLWSNVSTLNP